MKFNSVKAQATLEFALILPLFLILGLLLFQLGHVVKTQIVLAHSTREGARVVVFQIEAGGEGEFFDMTQAQLDAESAVLESSGFDPQKTQVKLKRISENLVEIEVSYILMLDFPFLRTVLSSLELKDSTKITIF